MHRLPRHNIIRVFEGFAGYGGATFGLRRAGIRHRVVAYSEVDEDAIELYHYNDTKSTIYNTFYIIAMILIF